MSSRALRAAALVVICRLALAHLPRRSFQDPHVWKR
jgi:hypothetical protein